MSNNSVITFDQDSDLYIVGNDCQSDGVKALNIKMNVFRPRSEVAKSFISKLNQNFLIENSRNDLNSLIEAGLFGANQANILRAKIKARVKTEALGPYRSLYDQWIGEFLSIMELRTMISKLEFRFSQISREIGVLKRSVESMDEDNLFRWSHVNNLLENLDMDYINNTNVNDAGSVFTFNTLLDGLEDSLLTMIRFRFREDINSFDENLALLRRFEVTDSFADIAGSLQSFINKVVEQFLEEREPRPWAG